MLVGLSGPFVALVSGPGGGAGRQASSQLPTPIPFLLGLYKSGRPLGKNHTQNDSKQKIKVMIGVLKYGIMTKSMARTLPEWKAGNSVEAKVIRWGRTEGAGDRTREGLTQLTTVGKPRLPSILLRLMLD